MILSARSLALAYFTWRTRISSAPVGWSICLMIFSIRWTFSATSVMISRFGGTLWMLPSRLSSCLRTPLTWSASTCCEAVELGDHLLVPGEVAALLDVGGDVGPLGVLLGDDLVGTCPPGRRRGCWPRGRRGTPRRPRLGLTAVGEMMVTFPRMLSGRMKFFPVMSLMVLTTCVMSTRSKSSLMGTCFFLKAFRRWVVRSLADAGAGRRLGRGLGQGVGRDRVGADQAARPRRWGTWASAGAGRRSAETRRASGRVSFCIGVDRGSGRNYSMLYVFVTVWPRRSSWISTRRASRSFW